MVTWALVMAVAIAMLTQFLVGYNTGVMNAPESVVFPGHTTTEWSLSVSSFAIGGPFGAMLAGVLANQWGRRATMLVSIDFLSPFYHWLLLYVYINGLMLYCNRRLFGLFCWVDLCCHSAHQLITS